MTRPLICYFGHHKAATSYLDQNVSAAICDLLGLNKLSVQSPLVFGKNIDEFAKKQKLDWFSYVNADVSYVDKIKQDYTGFHVIRDPRDIIVSAYFSHRYSHPIDVWPELIPHRSKLRKTTQERGLLIEVDFTKDLLTNGEKLCPFKNMQGWDYNNPNILELRYEDMVKDTEAFIFRVAKHLDLVDSSLQVFVARLLNKIYDRKHEVMLTSSQLKGVAESNSFKRVSGGRRRGVVDKKSHYRTGEPGDWKQYFTNDLKRKFKKTYPGLVSSLAYEPNEDW